MWRLVGGGEGTATVLLISSRAVLPRRAYACPAAVRVGLCYNAHAAAARALVLTHAASPRSSRSARAFCAACMRVTLHLYVTMPISLLRTTSWFACSAPQFCVGNHTRRYPRNVLSRLRSSPHLYRLCHVSLSTLTCVACNAATCAHARW